MSLLPLTVYDYLRRAYRERLIGGYYGENETSLAEKLISNASLVDVIRWRGVSRAFRSAARRRLDSYTRLHVRVFDGLAGLHTNIDAAENGVQWPSSAHVLLCEMGAGTVGIAVDSKLHWKDAKVMIGLIATFRKCVEHVYMDSPIVDLLLKHMNTTKVNALLHALSQQRRPSFYQHLLLNSSSSSFSSSTAALLSPPPVRTPLGPFFPSLKHFTVTCNKTQLSHLSRIIGYCVEVDNVFRKEQVDLVCLQVILGESWCRSKQRLFRHVGTFKQWLDASSLGVKYVQQFHGEGSGKRKRH